MSFGLAVITMVTVVSSSVELRSVVLRVEVLAVGLLLVGTVVGAERLIALASAPALAGAGWALVSRPELLWGRALIIACLWYLAVEAALGSVRVRAPVGWGPAIGRLRLNEVATVLAVTVVVATVTVAVGSAAPERTLVLRGAAFAVLVALLVVARRHLGAVVGRDRPA